MLALLVAACELPSGDAARAELCGVIYEVEFILFSLVRKLLYLSQNSPLPLDLQDHLAVEVLNVKVLPRGVGCAKEMYSSDGGLTVAIGVQHMVLERG